MRILAVAVFALLFAAPLLWADSSDLTLSPSTAKQSDEPSAYDTIAANREKKRNDFNDYFSHVFSANEPLYFLAGSAPSVKFQLSAKFQIINSYVADIPKDQPPAQQPWWTGFYASYTQTSLWDVGQPSAPFFDNTYRPEFFWQYENLFPDQHPAWLNLDFRTGLTHESNGKAGDDSRSMNSFFIEPTITLVQNNDFYVRFFPKLKVYLGSLADNRDIVSYRGYADWNLVIGRFDSWQTAFIVRIGDAWDKGSVQLDVTYPLDRAFSRLKSLYVDFQVFNGFGESMLKYNESSTYCRVGISLVR